MSPKRLFTSPNSFIRTNMGITSMVGGIIAMRRSHLCRERAFSFEIYLSFKEKREEEKIVKIVAQDETKRLFSRYFRKGLFENTKEKFLKESSFGIYEIGNEKTDEGSFRDVKIVHIKGNRQNRKIKTDPM